ncbi:MAG TPA: RNA pseudouridine synthase [Candidatus Paceibacterota bacterium]|jgi:23S rRNA pseudouridine1911/1915/1917 synthase|nr:RNA pseudouridine synthase [Candidatus Paceibacterota bacterium]
MEETPVVVYKDKRFLVVNKPAGMQVHPARIAAGKVDAAAEKSKPEMLTDWLLARYPELARVGDDPSTRPGIVHRLDKETSGILLVPRDQKYFEYLKGLFQKHEIKKTYLAFVWGEPKNKKGIIDAPIGIQSGTLKRSIRAKKMSKPAVTEYEVAKTFAMDGESGRPQPVSLLRVFPRTGRTHQIRVHLASIGHPVVGDRLYGPRKQPSWATRLMLHALSLEFTSADGKRLKFEAEPPQEFRKELSTGAF